MLQSASGVVIVPCVDVEKTVEPTVSKVGDEVEWTITVTNCGDQDLDIVSVIDTFGGDITSNFASVLPISGQDSFSYPYTIQESDEPGPWKTQ